MMPRKIAIDTNVLNSALANKGWGSSLLARKAGISRWSVIRAKKGTCSAWHIHLIAKALGIEESELIKNIGEKEKKERKKNGIYKH